MLSTADMTVTGGTLGEFLRPIYTDIGMAQNEWFLRSLKYANTDKLLFCCTFRAKALLETTNFVNQIPFRDKGLGT